MKETRVIYQCKRKYPDSGGWWPFGAVEYLNLNDAQEATERSRKQHPIWEHKITEIIITETDLDL